MKTWRRGHIESERARERVAKKKWRENLSHAEREALKFYFREYNKVNKEKLNIKRITRVYGISEEEYTTLLYRKNGNCHICNKPEVVKLRGQKKNLAVDHDKKTGKVRGLLCQKCNQAIGLLNHDVSLLKEAITYLV